MTAVYRNGLGVSDDEEGAVIYVATGLRSPWAAAWPSFRDYALLGLPALGEALAAG